MTIQHDDHDIGRVKSRDERTPTMAELDARAHEVYAADVPKMQGSVSLHDRQINPNNEGHIAGGDHNVADSTNPVQDTARDNATNAAPDNSSIERYADGMIQKQGVEPLMINYQTVNAQSPASHDFAIAQDTAPMAGGPMSPGMDGLTLATSYSAQEGSLKPLSDLKGLDDAIGGLRSGMGGGGQSMYSGGSMGASTSVTSPNHHSLQGAQNSDFMAARKDQANQSFAAAMPQK